MRSSADICIYGGAAGGGKTVGLILEPLRYATRVANFAAVFFRRSTPQITNPGGLWVAMGRPSSSDWRGCSIPVGAQCSVSLTNVARDCQLTASA